MRRFNLLLLGIFLISLTFISATPESWKYNYLDEGDKVKYGGNYTINTNYSTSSGTADFWDLLDTPVDLLLSMFSALWIDTDLETNGNNINLNNGNLTEINWLAFNVTGCPDDIDTSLAGYMCWDGDKNVIVQVTGLGNVVQISQEMFKTVKNVAGQTIYDGQIVSTNDSVGEVGTVILADANATNPKIHNLGMVTVPSCNNNAECIITMIGEVHDVPTSAFAQGDNVYLSCDGSGNLTNVRQPIIDCYHMYLGKVLRSHAETGIIDFMPMLELSNGVTIHQLGILTNLTVVGGIFAQENVAISENLTVTGTATFGCPDGYVADPWGGCAFHSSTIEDVDAVTVPGFYFVNLTLWESSITDTFYYVKFLSGSDGCIDPLYDDSCVQLDSANEPQIGFVESNTVVNNPTCSDSVAYIYNSTDCSSPAGGGTVIDGGDINTTNITAEKYIGNFSTLPNNYDWSVHDDGANVHMEFPTLGGSNYFGIETAGSFFQLYANPNPSNDYLMATITETQGADTFLNFYEGGTGHNRFWDSGSARFGGNTGYLCSELTTDVDCDTSGTGADVVVEDDIWAGGNIFAEENITLNGSTISSWDEVNVTTDTSNLVPYTGAALNVNLSDKNLTTTGEGDFGHLHIDDIHIDDEIISTSDAAALSAADAMEITITTGIGGSSQGAGGTQAGAGGDLHIQTGRGGAVAVPYSATSGDGGDLTFTLGNGGAGNGAGGQGGSFNVITGNGGSGGTPGPAGVITMTSGGSSSSIGNTGNGGDFTMAGGSAGASSQGTGGNGGTFTISGGDGGTQGNFGAAGTGGDLIMTGGLGGDGKPVGGTPGADGNVIIDRGKLLIGISTPFTGGNGSSVLQVQGDVSINGTLYTFSPTDENYTPLTRGNELPSPELILDANGHLSHDYLFEKETITDEWTEYPYEIEECALDEEGIEHCYTGPDTSRPVYKSQQKTDPFQIEFNNRLMLAELFENVELKKNVTEIKNTILAEHYITNTTKDLDTMTKIENFRAVLTTKTFQQVKDYVIDSSGKLSDNILMDTEQSEYGSYDLGAIAHFNRAMVIFLMKENLNQQEEIQELKDKEAARDACWDLNTQAEIIACQRAI